MYTRGMNTNSALVVRIPAGTITLPDNDQWTNRFEIHSSSSNRVYIIAQNKSGRFWGCSCFGWVRHEHCRHLDSLGLPGDHQPREARLTGGK
jgi:hypothetical protein